LWKWKGGKREVEIIRLRPTFTMGAGLDVSF
jgi:hypothetical protein